MKTLITVTRVGDSIRISKVTDHGEEVIEADVEARALGVLLWGKLANEEVSHGTPLLPWKDMGNRLDKLTTAVERLTAQIDNHAHAVTVLRTEFEQKKSTPVKPQRGQ